MVMGVGVGVGVGGGGGGGGSGLQELKVVWPYCGDNSHTHSCIFTSSSYS